MKYCSKVKYQNYENRKRGINYDKQNLWIKRIDFTMKNKAIISFHAYHLPTIHTRLLAF